MNFSLKYLLNDQELCEKFLFKIFKKYRNYAKTKIKKFFLSMLPHEMTAMENIYCRH